MGKKEPSVKEIGKHLNISENKIFSISQVSNYLFKKLNDDDFLSGIYIVGEISNLSKHKTTFFNLKDEENIINATLFESFANQLEFKLKEGEEVLVYGKIQFYKKAGRIQIQVQKVFPIGEGMQSLKLKKLKEKLKSEGLFNQEHKKLIPKLPRVIGIGTSTKGKALADIITSIKQRFSNVHIKVIPTIVQGEKAPRSIIRSIKILNKEDVDMIIIGRGGGSSEDIDCFNDEELAREIFKSNKPIITAIGHEHDWSIADHVADIRAITPTDTASKAVANKIELFSEIKHLKDSLEKAYLNRKIIENQKKEIFVHKEKSEIQKKQINIYKWIAIGLAMAIAFIIWRVFF